MNDNINRILETDKQARERLEKAKQAALEKRKGLEKDAADLRKKYNEKSRNEIEEVRKSEKAKIDSARNEHLKMSKATCEELDRHYKENADKWVEEIVKNVTQQ